MSWSEIENAYLDRLAAYEFPGTPPAEQEPAKGPEVTQPSAAPAEMRAIPRNETLGAVADFVGRVREMANQYEIKDWVPLLGGLGVGDLLVGKSPEEIENWAYGNLPATMPPPGTGGYVPVMKTGRKQSVADTAMLGLDVAGPAVGVGKIAKNIATEIATTPPVGAINIDALFDAGPLLKVAKGGTGVGTSTGTGSNVLSASPTLTGTVAAAAATLSGNLTLSGGTANVVLYDQNGDWNPTNPAGAYYPNLVPLRQIIIYATYASQNYFLFSGFITNYDTGFRQDNDELSTVTLRCVDGLLNV